MSRTVTEPALRHKLVEICHRMYRQGYIAAGDGNVSARIDEGRILVTPTGHHKGFITADDLVVVDPDGKLLRGTQKPSSEFAMHALAYRERPDIGAVVHAHPPLTVGLALAGVTLAQCVLSETCLVLGAILTAPYSTPTTDEVPRVLRPYVRQSNAVVMDRHGALTLGRDLDEAYNRLEAMEHASKITHAARSIGPVTPLPPHEVDKLQALAQKLGIPRAPDPCVLCNACPNGKGGPIHAEDDVVIDEVLKRLRGVSTSLRSEANALVAQYGAEAVIAALSPILGDERKQKLDANAAARLSGVAVVLENLHDPHNGGAALRSCEAFGLLRVHVVGTPLKFSERVTQGCEKWLEIDEHASIEALAAQLREGGFKLCAAVPNAKVDLESIDALTPAAFLVGNEHEGLSKAARALCDVEYAIPMHGFSESVNLSVATALTVYTQARRRRQALRRTGDSDEAALRRLRASYYARSVDGAAAIVRRHAGAGATLSRA